MGRPVRGNHSTKSERRESKGRASNARPKAGYGAVVPYKDNRIKQVDPLNEKQKLLIGTIIARTLTYATGCAGTGKSYIAIGVGLYKLLTGEVEQMVLTKPDFEIDERIGTLPGDADEKTALLFRSMRDIFTKMIGKSRLAELESSGKVKFEPLGSILGTTFDRAFMIMDEAQNSTPGQMKAFLTRFGQHSRGVICGDYREQKFVEGRCGLEDSLSRLSSTKFVGRVDFTPDDIVRSDFCRDVILAYRSNEKTELLETA